MALPPSSSLTTRPLHPSPLLTTKPLHPCSLYHTILPLYPLLYLLPLSPLLCSPHNASTPSSSSHTTRSIHPQPLLTHHTTPPPLQPSPSPHDPSIPSLHCAW
ncbi:hypothetical protein Pcinc_030660 [Petrolisthes cinctipes]|uniref:Uncharacterized protein n=1 Tax=Petrolisthes cinctipes TaxID=88211 RepID=A0AAE1K448_PETCI|nr:hypothetical protein Pcinc_030660 [Petrolisthes cinctipes]